MKFRPALGDQTLTLSLLSESNLNLSVTVNLCPPQVWPEFFTSFNTLSDELPLVSGFEMISWSPPSKPDKLPASSKSAITEEFEDEYWVISSIYIVKLDEPSPIVPLSINITRLYHSTDVSSPE